MTAIKPAVFLLCKMKLLFAQHSSWNETKPPYLIPTLAAVNLLYIPLFPHRRSPGRPSDHLGRLLLSLPRGPDRQSGLPGGGGSSARNQLESARRSHLGEERRAAFASGD